MLRMTMNKSANGAKKYYSEPYYNEGKSVQLDYYSDKDQVIGRWGGIGATKLGLNDDILKKDFASLCDNINPETDKKLTSRNDKDRTVGYDLTFNASKSVSLAYTFANDQDKKEILNVFRESVADTMKEIETGMQARVRGKGKNENRETGNIVYGEFVHFTTRPIDGIPDPHLHAHCFVFNATHDDIDNKWKAGQFRQIKQDAPYYEAYFHSKLAEKLGNCGYGIERTNNGFEVSGIEKETMDKFSRRTKEIEEHASANNITDDKQKASIGAKTRESKRINVDPEKEFMEWKCRLTDIELSKIDHIKNNSGSETNDLKPEVAKEALIYSLEHHLERKSVASDKEILATAIKASIGETNPEEIKKQFIANREILSVKEDNRTFITTKDALNEERQLILNANEFKGKFRPLNENYEFKSDILNYQQRLAVQHALSTTDSLTIITGKAGTGKTTLMKEIKEGINEAGKSIYSFAPSSEASRVVQRSEGFENADTLASLIQNKSKHKDFKNQVIWIDEAGMVSNKDMNQVFEIAKEQNARIILSGDTKQHNSVERGDALRVMQKYAGISSVTVDKIQRQKGDDYRQAVKFLSEANVEKGFKKLDNMGAIREIEGASDRIKAVAEDYYHSTYSGKGQQNVLVIAPTHAEGENVTQGIRNKLKENNRIDSNEREFIILKSLQFTAAEKKKIENYKPDQILAFHQNAKGIKAGSKLEVIATNDKEILARDETGRQRVLSLSLQNKFNVFEKRNIEVAAGDKLKITGNGKALDGKHLFNGTTYNISGFDKEGNIKLSNGSLLNKDYGHFSLGYVMTSHSAQGKTTDKIIISQNSLSLRASSMEQFYVSVSRGRHATVIYTDDKEALLHAVSQSVQRISATELLAKSEKLKAVVEHARLSIFGKMKDKAREVVEKLVQSKNDNYELPGTIRNNRTNQDSTAVKNNGQELSNEQKFFAIENVLQQPSCIDLRMADGRRKAIPYSYIMEIMYDASEGIELTTSSKKVKITGRDLSRLYDYLVTYRVKYIQENMGVDINDNGLFVKTINLTEL